MVFEGTVRHRPASTASPLLQLTGEFALQVAGRRVVVPHSVERVLAFLALSGRAVSRTRLAGVIWIDSTDGRAANNLRTALWRLNKSALALVDGADDRLVLARDVTVDVTELAALSRQLIDAPDDHALGRLNLLIAGTDVLPDWDDEWVVADRERFRLLRLEALERAAAALIERREFGRAVGAALGAVQSDPLRESARRMLIRIHLAEGNVAEGLREYRDYSDLLHAEIGLPPSAAMLQLIQPYQRAGTAVTVG
jgi:DNA-binding SARP family transcriptional activator